MLVLAEETQSSPLRRELQGFLEGLFLYFPGVQGFLRLSVRHKQRFSVFACHFISNV